MIKNTKILLTSIISTQLLSLFANIFSSNTYLKYNNMIKPYFFITYNKLCLFTTVLYGMFGLSFYFIYIKKDMYDIDNATTRYCSFILINTLSTILFYTIPFGITNNIIDIISIIYGIKCINTFNNISKNATIIFFVSFLVFIYYTVIKLIIYYLN